MASWTSPRDWTPGEYPTADQFDTYISNNDQHLFDKAAAAQTAADAAQGTANTGVTNAATAQGTANAADASAAYRARLYGAHANQAVIDTGPAAVNTPLLVQAGTYVGATNAAGDLAVVFPNAFPNACISFIANTGAAVFNGFIAVHDTGNAAAIAVRVYDNSGVALVSTTVRIVYIALGY